MPFGMTQVKAVFGRCRRGTLARDVADQPVGRFGDELGGVCGG